MARAIAEIEPLHQPIVTSFTEPVVEHTPFLTVIKGIINSIYHVFPDAPNYYLEAANRFKENVILGFLVKKIIAGLPTLVTLGLIGCCFCMMVTGDMSKWGGRAMMIFWIGAGLIIVLQ